MKCAILAAGEGKRMHPLTFTRPKVMLPVANKPILEWNLLNAKKAGLKDFIFVVGYKSEMVRDYFNDGGKWGVNIEYVNQGKPRGTGHAVGMVESFVDDLLVLCGDTVFGVEDIKKISLCSNSIGLYEVENPEQYGIVETKDDKVVKIFEKTSDPFTDVINAGIYSFKHEIFDFIKKTTVSKRGEYELTDAINLMAGKDKIKSVEIKSWRDIVYPWDLLDANKEILEKFRDKSNCEIEEDVTIKGNVVIGENTQVLDGAYIEGPCIIGDDCKIGPNCYIRPYTAVGDNCHVGNACEIKNSIVFDDSNIPHHNYVGDSVVGSGCNLGSGTKIANLRLDKKNIKVVLNGENIDTGRRKLGVVMGDKVQTGINSMFDVGSIVGNNVFVGPGALVHGEIKPKSKVF